MRISISSPIPDLGSIPGPSRPGFPSGGLGDLEFKLEIQGPATLSFNALKSGGGTNFSIDWGDNTVVSGVTTTSHSHTYGSGTFILAINSKDDSGPIDQFQITGSQTNKNAVKKILNWGTTPWLNLTSAFQNCHGLTHIDKSDFSSGATINLTSAFQNCDNLTTVDFTGWKASGNVTGVNMFRDCTALESFKLKGAINFASGSLNNDWFRDSGASTGCTFDIQNLNFSGSTGNQTNVKSWFYGSNIKIDSKLTNWTFPSATWNLGEFFRTATIIGSNATVDLSNWTLPSNSSTVLEAMFREFSTIAAAGGTEQVVNMSNWNFGSAGNLKALFHTSGIRRITGLSTWSSNGLTNIQNLFYDTKNLSIDANDNFTSSFWNNSNISFGSLAFYQLGSLTTSSTAGAFPNLNGATFSSINFNSMFLNAHFNTDVSLTGVNFPSANNIQFRSAFQGVELFHSNSTIDLSNTVVNALTVERAFRYALVDNIVFGNDFDFTNCTNFAYSFRSTTDSTVTFPMPNVTFPIDSNRPNYSSATDTRSYPAIDFSTCQADNLIRALHDTGGNASGNASTFDLKNSQVTGTPSVVNNYLDNVLPSRGWTITSNSTDAALPFVYPAYALDPTVYTTGISPTTVPSGATFSTTTNGVTVNPTTGVMSWASTFRGGIDLKCVYSDGCYNEVSFIVQVPLKMNITIPSGSTNFELKPQMSAGECFVDWGDNSSQTLTANTTHSYASSGSDQTYSVKIFDSPSGSKFTGFNSSWNATSGGYIDDIAQWGEIEWQNNYWFANTSKVTITATDTPNLSQATSLQGMFSSNGSNSVFSGGSAIGSWDVSTITNMSSMFFKITSANFTQNLSNWDVSKVTTLNRFNYTYPEHMVHNQNWVADWGNKTSKVEDFQYFMYGGKSNNIAVNSNMGNYNTSSATNMSYMFFNNGGDIANCKTKIVNAGQADEYIAWDVKKVENFTYMFAGGYGRFVSTEFPDNWYISGEGQDVNMQNMFGWFHGGGSLNNLTDVNSFATKTISAGNSPYGTQYTAWNMSNTTNLAGFAQQSATGNQLNWNINTWQISNKLTRFDSMFHVRNQAASFTYTLDQDLGHWDISNVTNATNSWFNNYPYNPVPAGFSVNFSRANYDSLLSIADGWGQHASSAQSGVVLNMGASQYTPGNIYEGTQGINTYHANKIYNGGADLRIYTSIGDVVERDPDPNGVFDTYAIITGYDAGGIRATTQGNIGPADYKVMDSDAAKGRVALINAGWEITDGGAYIQFASVEMTINVNAGDTFSITPQGGPNNFKIDWGDGNGFVGDPTNSGANYTGSSFTATSPAYASGGNKTVKICEDASQYIHSLSQNWNGPSSGDRSKIINIPNWGSNSWRNLYRTFFECDNLVMNTTTIPNLANGPSLSGMFYRSDGDFTNSNIGNWNMTTITRIDSMFQQASNFNVDISGWDVSNVTNISAFAYQASSFNQDLSSWNVANVTNTYLALGLTSFNHYLPWALNTSANPPDPYYLTSIFSGSAMSTNNYTDTIVYWANFVKNQTPDAPLNVNMSVQNGRTFDSNRSGGTNFANAFAAREFLTNAVASGGAGWTITGDTVLPLLVPAGKSLSFNGSSEYISLGRPSNLILTPGTDAMTISAYFKTNEEGGGCIYSFDAPSGSSNTRIKIGIRTDNGKIETTLNGNSTGQVPSSSTDYRDNQWHHVAVTIAASASTATVYIDGSSVGTTAIGSGSSINAEEGGAIGARTPSSPGFYFTGQLDEIMVWNTVISTSNITTLADAVGSGNVPNPATLSSGVQLWNRMGD